MRTLVFLLRLLASPVCFARENPKSHTPSVKDCLNYVNTASGIAARYHPFSRSQLQVVSDMEDKLIQCSNRSDADARLLYSLFDAEVRLSGLKQVWLVSSSLSDSEKR
jgi:hypothetical protein